MENSAKQTFEYLVSYYNMKRVPIFYTTPKGKREVVAVWDIENDKMEMVSFWNGSALVHYTDSAKDMLKEWAYEQIEDTIEIFKKLTSKDEVTIKFNYYRNGELTCSKEWSGTRDKLYEDFERANDKLRYCNSYYISLDKDEEELQKIWYRMNSYWRNFHIYYGDGIVD